MGFISFEELMGKIAQVQNKLEKEKAEKEALGIFEADENTEDKKGVEIGIDAINKQRLVIRNNTLCFDPLTPEEQKNVNKRSDSLYCCVKGLQENENTQTYGTASEVRSGKTYGNGSSYGKAYGNGSSYENASGYGKSYGKESGYGKSYGNASGYEKAYGNASEVRNEQPIGPTHINSDVIKNDQTVENVNGNQCGTTASSVTEKFAEFWEAYPKKYNVDQARRTFLNLNPDDELHKKILSAINNAKKSYSWKNQNGRFIPFPAKWLRNHCWEEFKYDFYG